VGSVALRPVAGEENAATVGYWIAERTEGRGLAFEAAAAVVRAAFELGGFTRLEIHCDASNEKSRALAERLGFRLDALLRERGHAPGEARAVHSLLAPEFAASPAARVAVRAEDALGDLLLPRPAARSAGFR
jgi:RimJ/RimL family protein N-acetyltransferase